MSALARWVFPLVICALAWQCGDPLAPPPLEDPIALEVTAMRATLAANAAKTDPLWVQVRPGVTAALDLDQQALAEASAFQVKVMYDAGLEYGRATDADSGLFYVGSAKAQQQFAAFARTVLQSSTPVLSVRSLVAETDALETTLLALYRPPVSIDRHSEFIGASSALKEARELDAAGLRYGALQRYLLAVLRTALLRPAPALSESAAIRARLLAAAPTLSDYSIDHTIAIMFLERALTELDRPEATAASVGIALAVADEVLPKYFAALEAAPADSGEASVMPALNFTDLNGRMVRPRDLAGKVVVVEFWATWCPPCRSTLAWLGELQKKHGDRVVVLALAIESDEPLVRRLASELNVPLRWAMRSPAMLAAFGDVSVVPTLLVYDPRGRMAGAYYGAPPTLHQDADATIARPHRALITTDHRSLPSSSRYTRRIAVAAWLDRIVQASRSPNFACLTASSTEMPAACNRFASAMTCSSALRAISSSSLRMAGDSTNP